MFSAGTQALAHHLARLVSSQIYILPLNISGPAGTKVLVTHIISVRS